MFTYTDLREKLIRGGLPPGEISLNHSHKKKNPDVFTSGFLYQLLPCAAGATFSTYEYLFLLDLVLGRVVDDVYLDGFDYLA